jgi:hypothetical protein
MATIASGINGGFSGKAGTVVGYYRLGQWVIRAKPRKSTKNKRGTPEQKASRSLFTKMQYFLFPTLSFIRVGFNMEGRSKQMTAHNAAKSYNMLNAFTPEGEIDFSKVVLTFGNLPGALNATVEKDDAGLHFSWDNNSNEKLAEWRDQVMVLAYDDMIVDINNEKQPKAYYLLSGARRNTGNETLEIHSPSKGHTLHTYIAFISDNRERISMSTYLGEIVY